MSELLEQLRKAVGESNVLAGESVHADYTHDEALTSVPVVPLAVVLPGSTDEVSEILRVASEHRVPVVARGSGTGLSGAAVPVAGGILLAFDRMKRILEIDTENQVAVVEPGVTLEQLNGELAPLGLVYPVSPGEQSGSLGGNVATNAGGMRAVRYGVTRHHVLGLEVVLADGTVLRTGGKFVKVSSGYDLTQLLIGSEGTLAITTEVTVKLQPRFTATSTVLAPFATLSEVAHAVPHIVQSGINPSILEYVDILVMGGITQAAGLDLGVPEDIKARTLAYLVVVLEGMHADRVEEDVERLATLLEELGSLDVYVLPPTSGAQLIAARERAFFVGKAAGCDDLIDAVIPRATIPDYLAQVAVLAQEHGAFVTGCGHIGDGNVHITVFQPDEERRHDLMQASFELALRVGGAISGEHGIGTAKLSYFLELEDPVSLELMRSIKRAFDPDGILNPDRLLGVAMTGRAHVNGARALLSTLVDADVDVCFANPGTSEMHFVAALDDVPAMRGILCLFEGVVTGAADGYGRVAGRPAATLLHLGPGLGNGLANLHNARRARTPIVNIVGDHATYHARYDAPLQSDIASIAGSVSGWYRSTARADDVAADGADAVAAALGPPGCVATLVLPADASWSESSTGPCPPRPRGRSTVVPADTVAEVAKALRGGERCALLLGGSALRADGLQAASRVAVTTGALLLGETFPANLERGAGIPAVDRLAYLAEMAQAQLDGVRHLVLVDAKSPVSFFAYPDKASDLVPPGCTVHTLVRPGEDAAGALEGLAELRGRAGRRQRSRAGGPPGPSRRRHHRGDVGCRSGRHAARGRHRRRRGEHLGPLRPGRDRGGAAPRLADAHGRGHRHRAADGHRRGGGGPGAAGPLPAGRRQRHVHAPGAVDPGARRPERDDAGAVQQELRHFEHGAPPGWRRRRRGARSPLARPHRSRPRLLRPGPGHGRPGPAGRERRRPGDRARNGFRRGGPDAH